MHTLGPDKKAYPVAKIAIVTEALQETGVEPAQVLRGTGLDVKDLSSAATHVSIGQVLNVYSGAARIVRDPGFAFRTGLRFHVSAYGMYGFAILSSTDFRQTHKFAVQYHQLATPVADIHFREIDGKAVWTVTPISLPEVDTDLYRFLVELQFGHFLSLHRDVMGPQFAPLEFHLAYAKPRGGKTFAEVPKCKVSYGQAENKFVFDARVLDGPTPLGNHITNQSLIALCDALLEDLQLGAGVAGQVRAALLEKLGHDMSLVAVSERLDIPPRTLRRKLQQEGTSFREIVDQLRAQLSVKYLRDTELTVEDIAFALGFSDAANFRQALRRWTGKSPSQLRKRAAAR